MVGNLVHAETADDAGWGNGIGGVDTHDAIPRNCYWAVNIGIRAYGR